MNATRRLAVLAATLLAPVFAHAQAPAASHVAVPPIPFTERVLKNGLHVFTARDVSTPNVSVQVWYGVGSKDDPQGRSGFAHLFEHMMFKAARDMPAEHMDRLTEDVGGANNASTWDDFTNFYEIIPANHLEVLLWAEAERMSSLSVDQANFASERAVVEEELRQSYLANPYGRLSLAIQDASYAVHPYKRSTIGSIGDLDAATLPDVKAFHDTYYRPDNANLIVVGNFDPKTLDAWIDTYFGDIGNPDKPAPRVTVVEPARTGPNTTTVYAPNVPLPAVDITWQIPAASSRDLAALRIADAVLSTGDSSRLNHDLVYERQIAQSINSDAGQNAQPSLFQVQAVMAGGKTLDEGEAALRDEVKRLRDVPVAADELARAKNQLVASALQERETAEGRAFEIGHALLVEGDAKRANTDIAELEAVTAADVQRAAQTYLLDNRRVVIRYLDDSQRPAGEKPAPDLAEFSPQVDADALPSDLKAAPPPASLPATVPTPARPVAAAQPVIADRTLPNGLRVIVAKTSDVPMVTADLTLKSGGASDPAGRAGLAAMTADLLPKGTTTRSATEIAADVEAAGGSLKSATSYDGSELVLTVLADQLPATLPILGDVARHPAFAPEEIERLRRQKLDDLAVNLKQPGDLAAFAAAPAVFGASAYGHVLGGTPRSLKAVTRADIQTAYARAFRPDEAILVLTGDIDPETGFALAEKTFGDWTAPSTPPPAPPIATAYAAPRVIAIDIPAAGQAAVLLAAPTVGRNDPRYYAVRAVNAVLGGGYSARLNEEVRIKRGLSYGAGSRIDARNGVGLFTAAAQTKNASAADVASLVLDEARTLGAQPIPVDELTPRKASLVGNYGRAIETSAGLAGVLTLDALYGVDLRDVGLYPQKVDAIGPDEARAAARAAVDPSTATLIVVGDAKQFIDKLKARFPNAERIEASALDLDAPSLSARADTPQKPRTVKGK
jgi:zinc protease